MSDMIDVTIFIEPTGEKVDYELPVSSSPQDIVESLLEDDELKIERKDIESGEPIAYRLMKRGKRRDEEPEEIDQDVPLWEQGITRNSVFTLVQDMEAG